MDDLQNELDALRALGLTAHERGAVETFARVLVNCGARGELLRQFLNQVHNECKRASAGYSAILDDLRAELGTTRQSGPQTPGEFWALHGGPEGEVDD